MDKDDKIIVVARFSSVEEAHLAASRLNNEGIEAEVEPFHAYDVMSFLQYATRTGGVGIMVPARQANKAREVLDSFPTHEEIEAQEPPEAGEAVAQENADEPEGRGPEPLPEDEKPVPEPLQKSQSALILAISGFALPVSPWALWNALRIRKSVLQQADGLSAADRARCRKRMAWATVVSILATLWYILIVLVMILGRMQPGR